MERCGQARRRRDHSHGYINNNYLNLTVVNTDVKHWFYLQVRAGESLMKLVSDIKQFLILNDFRTVNEAIHRNTDMYHQTQRSLDQKLLELRDDIAADLYELEEEYYSSAYK